MLCENVATFFLVAFTQAPTDVCSNRSGSKYNAILLWSCKYCLLLLKMKKRKKEKRKESKKENPSEKIPNFIRWHSLMKYMFSSSCNLELYNVIWIREGGLGEGMEVVIFFLSNLHLGGPFHILRSYVVVTILHTVLSPRKSFYVRLSDEGTSTLLLFHSSLLSANMPSH